MPLERDTTLEQRFLEAVIADRNSDARTQQREVGPSEVGGCRELLRASIFEADTAPWEPEDSWPVAAHVGTVMGSDLERIFGERLDAETQRRITTHLGDDLGVAISGSGDALFLKDGILADLKGVADMGGLIYDMDKNGPVIDELLTIHRRGNMYDEYVDRPAGRFELTTQAVGKISKLKYFVQQAIYVTGLRQDGTLGPDSSARLVFFDRSGGYQQFVVYTITAEMIDMFFRIAQQRVQEVVDAQDLLEAEGDPALIHGLRDMAPSFCFSEKVLCPLRNRCWGGTDWAPIEEIDGAEIESAIDRYDHGRALAKLGDEMKRTAREELKGIKGRTRTGWIVGWESGRISVVRATRPNTAKQAQEQLS